MPPPRLRAAWRRSWCHASHDAHAPWGLGVGWDAQARAAWNAWGGEAAFSAYAQAHLAHLDARADAERLHMLSANVKRAYRSLRQAPEVRSLTWERNSSLWGGMGMLPTHYVQDSVSGILPRRLSQCMGVKDPFA